MNQDFVINGIEKELKTLTWQFNDHKNKFNLIINTSSITFWKCDSEFGIKPNKWLKLKHQDGRIHELGTIAVLSFFSKYIKKIVVFYDIGALFGYFSSIVQAMFPNSRVILIEGNPLSCKCIKKISPHLPSDDIINVVLGNKEKYTNYLVNGFTFIDGHYKIRIKRLDVWIKNKIKALLNRFGKRYMIRKIYDFKIKQDILPNIFKKQQSSQLEIFKIDTEGNQCRFLPPFINELCSRNPIILLEIDHPDKMADFGMTNDEILQLFLKRDYVGYWLDHRSPSKVKRVFKITKEEDFNSLLVLIPKSKAEEIFTDIKICDDRTKDEQI